MVEKGFEGGSGSGEGADVIRFPKGNEFLMRQGLINILKDKGVINNRGETFSDGPMLLIISQRGFANEVESNNEIIQGIKTTAEGKNCNVKVLRNGQLPSSIDMVRGDVKGAVDVASGLGSKANDLVVVVCQNSGEHLVQQAVVQGYCGVIIFTNNIGIKESMTANSQAIFQEKKGGIGSKVRRFLDF